MRLSEVQIRTLERTIGRGRIVIAEPILQVGEFQRRDTCRVCHGQRLLSFLDYGMVPLAGDFIWPDQVGEEKVYPLDLVACQDCTLVQILNVVDAHTVFDDYRYLSSVTKTLTQHFRDYARVLHERVLGSKTGLVVEFGCNDGVLLSPLKKLGIKAIGVDAAENVVHLAREKGLDVWHGFFGADIAQQLKNQHGPADVITASNVFAHIDDLDGVLRGVDQLLADDGTVIVEVHYLGNLLEQLQFDTVYHEHLCYYSVHAIQHLFGRFGFTITDVARLPMHGGAIRVFARRSLPAPPQSPNVERLLKLESLMGMKSETLYQQFGEKVLVCRDAISDFVNERKQSGRTIAGYGAAGRATTLLNFCGLGQDTLDYIVDESPSRVGRCVPGIGVPIVSRSHFAAHPTDDCLLTAWNYRQEIVNKEKQYLANGGTFLTPLPRIETVEGSVTCRLSA